MSIADLLKKNFVLIPVIASVLFGTFTGVKYIVNLERDLKVSTDKITDMNTRLSSAEATWLMAENLYRTLADEVREMKYDIKDLNRDLNN